MPALAQDALMGHYYPSKAVDSFDRLVQDLSATLGPSSGLDSADVNSMDLQRLMEGYTSSSRDWAKYAWSDDSRAYTRNLVDRGNGKSNLLILVWTPGKGSPIHDHADAHCVMKVLRGSLKETLYNWPDRNLINDGGSSPLIVKKETVYTENRVTYMSDNVFTRYPIQILGILPFLYTVSKPAFVALNLPVFELSKLPGVLLIKSVYTPPNAAKVGCHMYDEKTGKSSHVQQCNFYSELGQKL